MELLLAEQTMLLVLDDSDGRDTSTWAGGAGLAAALLLDLGERDLLRVGTDEALSAEAGPPPQHPVLRRAHEVITASKQRRDAKGWVDQLQRELDPLHERLARGLVERGVLSEERSKLLGLFPRTRFPEADPAPERELRQRVFEVLLDGRSPSEEEALLIGLLEPLELIDRIVPRDQRRHARQRAEEIGELGVAGTAVRRAVHELQAAVITSAVIVPVIVSSSS